jgi:hypothetical protein
MSKENHKWNLRQTHKKDAHCNVNQRFICGCFGDTFFNPKHKLSKQLRVHRKNTIILATNDPYDDWTLPRVCSRGNLRFGLHRPSICGSDKWLNGKIH